LWAQERFQEIRNLVNKHEKDLLLNLETILTVGKALLRKQSIILCQREKQLNHFKHFTSSILLPFRLQEVFMYSDWIPIKCQEEVKEDDDKECKTIALLVIFQQLVTYALVCVLLECFVVFSCCCNKIYRSSIFSYLYT